MDPLLNCLLEICCNPLKAHDALTKFYVTHGGLDAAHAKKAAACTLEHFDLAERGTLQPFKESIARLARAADYKE